MTTDMMNLRDFVEKKRRYNGHNNGRIILSHRDAAKALNVHRNTVGSYFADLMDHGLIAMVQGPYLGPSGVGLAAWWALQELPTADGKPAQRGFQEWRKPPPPAQIR